MKKVLVGFLLLLILQGCGIKYRNRVFDELKSIKPMDIGILVSYKNILERPASAHQFSATSLYPDTIDRGSNWGYKKNSSEANVVRVLEVAGIFSDVLAAKGYRCRSLELEGIHTPDSIVSILRQGKNMWTDKTDAVLFVDFSDMFNRNFAGKGVMGNPGYALFVRYVLFDIEGAGVLLQQRTTVHPEFYSSSQYSHEEMRFDLLNLLKEELAKEFPDAVGPAN